MSNLRPLENQFIGIAASAHQTSCGGAFLPRHKKKPSLHQKGRLNFIRLKTDERQISGLSKSQQFSISMLGQIKKPKSNQKIKKSDKSKPKRSKHTMSVINLGKGDDVKGKGSSTITKRKQSSVQFGERIRQKMEDFRIIAGCLQEYVLQQRRNNGQADPSEIIKMIKAFNKSQISTISKPLEALISDIVLSIQNSLPGKQVAAPKSILKKSTYQSPAKGLDQTESHTVKKGVKYEASQERRENAGGDVRRLEQNLGRLKYESNRLRYFFDEISLKSREGKKDKNEEQVKLSELQRLKDLAEHQALMIEDLSAGGSHEGTFRDLS